MTTDWTETVSLVHDDYLRQYKRFCDDMMSIYQPGSPEVALQLSESARVFRRLVRVDFAGQENGEHKVIEMEHPPIASAATGSEGSLRNLRVVVNPFCWSTAILELDSGEWSEAMLANWFDDWFGLESGREESAIPGRPGGMIHHLTIDRTRIHVDFGSAPSECFEQLIEIAAAAGRTQIRITDELSLEGPSQ